MGVWALVQGVHVAFRYKALSMLRFRNISQKRAAALVQAHVAGLPLPSVDQVNAQESMLVAASAVRPCVEFGCSLEEAFGSGCSAADVAQHVALFSELPYVLVQREGVAKVLLKEQCSARELLMAMWQAAWLELHCSGSGGGSGVAGSRDSLQGGSMVAGSISALQQQYSGFTALAAERGWDVQQVVLKVGPYRIRV